MTPAVLNVFFNLTDRIALICGCCSTAQWHISDLCHLAGRPIYYSHLAYSMMLIQLAGKPKRSLEILLDYSQLGAVTRDFATSLVIPQTTHMPIVHLQFCAATSLGCLPQSQSVHCKVQKSCFRTGRKKVVWGGGFLSGRSL